MCNNKYVVPEFPILPINVSLYDFKISETYSFMVDSKSMIVKPSTKEKEINKITCYLYPCRI